MKKIGYCANPARNRSKDFAEIMEKLILPLSKCKSADVLWQAVVLPLKLYALFIQEILIQGKANQLQKAIEYVLEDFFAHKSPILLEEIIGPKGLLAFFPKGEEKILLDYICTLPEKVFRNYLFFAERHNMELYLNSIEELIGMLEKANGNKSWLDRLESLVQNQQEKAA